MSEDVKLSGKLMALRELLWDAGIGKRYFMSQHSELFRKSCYVMFVRMDATFPVVVLCIFGIV